MILILSLLLISCLSPVQLQDSYISISPTSSVCVGDTVSITCYIYASGALEFQSNAELTLYGYNTRQIAEMTFNINSSIPGYSVTGDIPTKDSTARLQLTIHSYQLTDSSRAVDCSALTAYNGTVYLAAYAETPRIAAVPRYPSAASLSTTTPESAVACPSIIISWSPRSYTLIDTYYLYRVVASHQPPLTQFITATADSQYTIGEPLNATDAYSYYVIASNCVGNSSQSATVAVSLYVFIVNLTLSYDPTDRLLSVDWVLVSFTFPRYIRYSLNLTYSLSDGDTTQEHSYVHIFSQLTNDTAMYYAQLSHALSAGDSVSVCLEPVEQCGGSVLPVASTKQCYSYSPATAVPTLSSAEESTLALSVLFVVVFVYSLFSVPVICLLTASVVHLRIQIHRNIKPIPDHYFLMIN